MLASRKQFGHTRGSCVLQKEKEQHKQEKKLKTELAGFGSMKTIEKSRNAFTVGHPAAGLMNAIQILNLHVESNL